MSPATIGKVLRTRSTLWSSLAIVVSVAAFFAGQRDRHPFLLLLILSGVLAAFFTRNMAVVFFAATLFSGATFFLHCCLRKKRVFEGLENADSANNAEDDVAVADPASPSDPTSDAAAAAPVAGSSVAAPANQRSGIVLEEADPPTAVERKLDDLQTKLDRLQSDLTAIRNANTDTTT